MNDTSHAWYLGHIEHIIHSPVPQGWSGSGWHLRVLLLPAVVLAGHGPTQ
jgi:hypothetical protein